MPENESGSILQYFYPEVGAGGFSRVNSSVDFYLRINALLRPEFVVLDFGAGRGAAANLGNTFPGDLRRLRGKVKKVIGVDLDPAIHQNPWLDEAKVLAPGAPLPFDDASFDMIVSDWTLEHIVDVESVTSELARVMKPGGWLCARTPNRWGYIALGARLTPRRLQAAILSCVQPTREEIDVFPKYYRLNTSHQINKFFKNEDFEKYLYCVNSEPAYFGASRMLWRIALLAFRMTPEAFGAIFHVFLQKKLTPPAACRAGARPVSSEALTSALHA
jgi:SAM-dependent methyltransferase